MKKLFLWMVFGNCLLPTGGQNLAEWTRQKKTQIRYLTDQVAALQVYISCTAEGYTIARKGLGLIGVSGDRDLGMHVGYFSSLRQVNPNLKNHRDVAEVMTLQISIVSICEHSRSYVITSGLFTEREISYILGVHKKILDDVAQSMAEMIRLLTPGDFLMKDNERIEGVRRIWRKMKDNSGFALRFRDEWAVLGAARLKEGREVAGSRLLYGGR
jgi:hypothetical protein